VATATQERWMRLIELLNSEEFDYPSSWFEAADGTRSLLMANRTVAAQHIPSDAQRMRIDGETWVRGDEWITEDIQGIHDKLRGHQEYLSQIRDGVLFIELAPVG
jgi:hypothetical protein